MTACLHVMCPQSLHRSLASAANLWSGLSLWPTDQHVPLLGTVAH